MLDGIISGIGNVAGSIINAWSASKDRENHNQGVNQAINTLNQGKDYAQYGYDAGVSALDQLMNSQTALYGSVEDAATALQNAQTNLNSVTPYTASDFSYDKSIEDFYDPAYQLSVNTANDGINQSQALGGNLFSSDTANKIAAQSQVLASNMYKDALSAYQTDKGLEQSIWQGNQSAQQAAASQALQLAQAQLNAAQDTASNLSSAQNTYYQGLSELGQNLWSNNADYLGTMAQIYASK